MSLIAIAALVAVGLFLQRAGLGTAIRAVSDNRDLSVASGIDDKKVILMVWVLSGRWPGSPGSCWAAPTTCSGPWASGSSSSCSPRCCSAVSGTTFGAMFGGLFVGIV